MKWNSFLSFLVVFFSFSMTVLHAETVVQDTLRPSPTGSVKIKGYLGELMNRSYENQIMSLNVDSFLKFYRDHSDNDGFKGEFWGKWFTAAALAYQNNPTDILEKKIRYAADELMKTEEPDGYIGSYTKDRHIIGTWDIWNRKYAILGLITDYDLTGNVASLEAASRTVDCLIHELDKLNHKITDNGIGVLQGVASMSIIEPVALLAQRTGKPEHRRFAETLVAQWSEPNRFFPEGPQLMETALEGKPPLKGHAYAIMSCFEGVCEMYRLTGDSRYLESAVKFAQTIRKYELMVNGSFSNQELFCEGAFTQTAILNQPQETCVTVTWMKLCYQLLRLTGNPLWADELEISLYNALLGAMTPQGGWWAYHSPLTGERLASHAQHADPGVSCCMMNAPRALFLTSRWAMMESDDGFALNLYAPGIADFKLRSGNQVRFVQETDYPVSGKVKLHISPARNESFPLKLRIPAWRRTTTLLLNGKNIPVTSGNYALIHREWEKGDEIELTFDMTGRVLPAPGSKTHFAIMRGPILLALDNRFVEVDDNNLWLVKNADETIDLEEVHPTPDGIRMAFTVPFEIRPMHFFSHSKTKLTMCDFASAGNLWSENNLYRSWISFPLYMPHAFVPRTWKLLNANPHHRAEIPDGK